MFDYNTHKDFGSGDRICYHGVMDMFRNPKMAASIYSSQQEETPVLELSSTMDIGEHPGCNRGDTWIFTNADSVKMYKNGTFIKEYTKDNSPYRHLVHPPILIDDYIGDQLITNEGFSKKQSDLLKEIFKYVSQHGMNDLPVDIKAKAARLMAVYHMKMQDATDLYTKYVGDWGGKSTTYKFEAVKNGEVVKTIYKAPMRSVFLTANSDKEVLHDVKLSGSEFTDNAAAELSDLTPTSYDVAAVRIQVVDDNGNVLPFFNDPVTLELKSKNGAAEIIGPKVISLSGGVGGTYIKTTGVEGEAELIIRSEQAGEVTLSFTVSK
jgi:beta-galactosidase